MQIFSELKEASQHLSVLVAKQRPKRFPLVRYTFPLNQKSDVRCFFENRKGILPQMYLGDLVQSPVFSERIPRLARLLKERPVRSCARGSTRCHPRILGPRASPGRPGTGAGQKGPVREHRAAFRAFLRGERAQNTSTAPRSQRGSQNHRVVTIPCNCRETISPWTPSV